MIFTVFCCTFMNHCSPDSCTKTHISSRTKHVFFNNSSLQKIHISSHPEHAFFHKGSHILSICSANVAQHLEFVAQHFHGPKNKKKQKQKTKESQPSLVGARIGCFFLLCFFIYLFFGVLFFWFFGFLVFWFFGCLVVWFVGCLVFWLFYWSTEWPCRKCMSSIKIHCKYQWF